MSVVSMKALLETGVHFGHRTRRWNPKMRPYIFTERNGIHILDLQQTIVMLEDAYNLIRDAVAEGGQVLFVGTKRQAQDTIAREAARANQPYVSVRWLGGMLTNWQTISKRIQYLEQTEARMEAGEFDLLKKRERLRYERELKKLNDRLGGIRKMKGLPSLVFIVDVNGEETAVREANILDIPIIGVVDTNSDPDPIDFIIPSNDDAIRAIKLIVGKMADAALEGAAMRSQDAIDAGDDVDDYSYDSFDGMEDAADEDLLGEATLAKLREADDHPAEIGEVKAIDDDPTVAETPAVEESESEDETE